MASLKIYFYKPLKVRDRIGIGRVLVKIKIFLLCLTEFCNSYMRILRGLLSSTDVDLRITAGEAIALVLEAAYEYDEVGI